MTRGEQPNVRVGPVVDDLYWVTSAGKLITETIPKIDAQAQRLSSAVAWYWTAYTALVIGGTFFGKDLPPVPAVVLVAPIALLMAAYAIALLAQGPSFAQFDPRVPREIENTFLALVEKKRARLRWAVGFTLLAAASICVIVVIISLI